MGGNFPIRAIYGYDKRIPWLYLLRRNRALEWLDTRTRNARIGSYDASLRNTYEKTWLEMAKRLRASYLYDSGNGCRYTDYRVVRLRGIEQ